MEEKFDAEFKRKVKDINPEIPDIVKSRINDTLASLPSKRSWRKYGYLSAVAALLIACFIGIRYIYPMGLKKTAKNESAQNLTVSGVQDADKAIEYTAQDSAKSDKTAQESTDSSPVENNTNGTLSASLKTAPITQPEVTGDATYGVRAGTASNESKDETASSDNDGKTADDQGIKLTLKTAVYDGKEIRIEFDKTSENIRTFSASGVQEKTTAPSVNVDTSVKNTQVNVAVQYDARIVVNDIPLKCSINVIETPQGENQYSGTMIIIPASGLPEDFDMILNLNKIGEISGQWLLKAHVKKQ